MDRYSGEAMKQEILDTVSGLKKQIKNEEDLEYISFLSDVVNNLEYAAGERPRPFTIEVSDNDMTWEFANIEQAQTFWNEVIERKF